MSFGKMSGFADIVKNRQVKDSEGFTIPRMKSSLPSVCTGKVGTVHSVGQTSPHSAKRPTCSVFGVFRG